MGTETREADHPLIGLLQQSGRRFSFFQVIRLLHMLSPDAPKIGHQGPPQKEIIRIKPSLGLAFNISDVAGVGPAELRREDGGPRWDIEQTFLGLYGTSSPMPIYQTEELIEHKRHAIAGDREGLARRFLDLFHHRLLSLFYRVWEKYRISAQFREDGKDYFSKRLLAMLHLDPSMFPGGHQVRPMDPLAAAGHVVQQPRSATTLLGILREYFYERGFEIDIEQCVEAHVDIPAEQQNRLGIANCTLGEDINVGSRVPDRASTFRVILGPLDLQTFLDFLPPGELTGRLRELVDLFNPDCLQLETELRIEQDEIPECRLSSGSALLGWSTWLGNPPEGTSHVRFLSKDWRHG